MKPAHGWTLAAIFLASCASPSRVDPVDQAWDVFEARSDAALKRADAVLDLYSQEPRTPEDEETLARISQPPDSPAAQVILLSVPAGMAYMGSDLAGIQLALARLDQIERYMDDLEAHHTR